MLVQIANETDVEVMPVQKGNETDVEEVMLDFENKEVNDRKNNT